MLFSSIYIENSASQPLITTCLPPTWWFFIPRFSVHPCLTCRRLRLGFFMRDVRQPLSVRVNNKLVDFRIISSISVWLKKRTEQYVVWLFKYKIHSIRDHLIPPCFVYNLKLCENQNFQWKWPTFQHTHINATYINKHITLPIFIKVALKKKTCHIKQYVTQYSLDTDHVY